MLLFAAAAGADVPREPTPAPSASPTPAPPLQFRSIGPAVSGGRVATIAGSDRDPALVYVGAAGGGVWKSTNGGASFAPIFDHEGTQSIGAIAVAPGDPSDVWVGTGEAWVRNDVLPGDGIYRSRDGGKTWRNMGLRDSSQIARVLIDPRDSKRIVVAALGDPFKDSEERGVFRSTDGGATWTKTLYRGPGVGASDLAMDPKHPDVLYAGLWRFRRSAWHLWSGGTDDGIYKSTDGGATWTQLTGHGLPATMGRIGLAFAPSDPARLYALIEADGGVLWRSDDGGANWTMTSSNTLINERPFYYSRVVVDPHDANHLFSVSVKLAESRNGGKTWHVSGKGLHGDHHDLWISADGKTIFEANDGGTGISRDSGATWTWRNVLPISQFYHVSVSETPNYAICGGLQDNGSWCAPSLTGYERGILAQNWIRIGGGDGTYAIPSPHGNQVFTTMGGGDNQAETMRWDSTTGTVLDVSPYLRDQNVVAPSRLPYRFNWETPLAFDEHDAGALYLGGNVVFRSRDGGRHWTPISADLTRNLKDRQTLSGGLRLDVTGAETYDTILALAVSPRTKGELWAGTDDGVVQLSRDGGLHWANVTIPGLDSDARVTAIDPSHRVAGRAYATVDRHFVGDRTPYVYVTDDFGTHWRAISHGLPAAEAHAVREDPQDPSVLYAGTGKGVWWSEDRGASWQRFPAPLPPVEVHDLVVQPARGDLVVATHGRGMYVFDDLAPLRAHRAAQAAGAALFAPRLAIELDPLSPTVNADAHAGPPRAVFTFWQNAPAAAPPAIEIRDAQGRLVRRIAGTHDEDGERVPNITNLTGYNRVTWDLGAEPPTPWRRIAPWDQGPSSGPLVPGGTYTVRLLRNGASYEQKLAVLHPPEVTSHAAEREGYAFAQQMNDELSRLDDALNVLDNVRLQLPDRITALRDPALAARARMVLDGAQRLEATISSQPVNDQDDDFLEDLLRERLLTFTTTLAPGAPTGAQRAEGTNLQREGDVALANYHRFLNAELVPLNDALRAAGVMPLDLQAIPAPHKPDPDADEHARRSEDD